MRRKPLPAPPDDLGAVAEAQAALPLVPGPEEDCCARIQGRLALPGRDDAATWLALLETLGLAEAGASGYRRLRDEADADALAEAFLDGVLGAREARGALAEAAEPLDAETVAERTADAATPWERRRHGADWPTVWTTRTGHLLDWLVLLGLAEREDGGYRPAAE